MKINLFANKSVIISIDPDLGIYEGLTSIFCLDLYIQYILSYLISDLLNFALIDVFLSYCKIVGM